MATRPMLLHSCGWILLSESPGALASVGLAGSMLISTISGDSLSPYVLPTNSFD